MKSTLVIRLAETHTVDNGQRTVRYVVPSDRFPTSKNLRLAFCRGFHARTEDFADNTRTRQHRSGYAPDGSSYRAYHLGYDTAESQEAV